METMCSENRTKEPQKRPCVRTLLNELKSGKYKNVVFAVGAGISTSAGIPDFRTPGTGLYSNLEKLNLPYPEAVFDISYLRERPEAFYTLARDLYPSKFDPTSLHKLIKWIEGEGYLKRVYTQNIDCLERLAGVSPEKIVEAHGSFAANHCIDCNTEASQDHVEQLLLSSDKLVVPQCSECGGIVKPDIVFFGEALPSRFFDLIEEDFNSPIDLMIVAGTSLQVQPFAQLPDMVSKSVPRVLLNMDRVGSLGRRKNDMLILGPLEDVHVAIEELLSDTYTSLRESPKADAESKLDKKITTKSQGENKSEARREATTEVQAEEASVETSDILARTSSDASGQHSPDMETKSEFSKRHTETNLQTVSQAEGEVAKPEKSAVDPAHVRDDAKPISDAREAQSEDIEGLVKDLKI